MMIISMMSFLTSCIVCTRDVRNLTLMISSSSTTVEELYYEALVADYFELVSGVVALVEYKIFRLIMNLA